MPKAAPQSSKTQKYLVTSALPYVNGIKHLGNFVGSLLPADVYTRYLKAQGHDAIYICATDDHGTPAELGALEEGMPVEQYVKKYHDIQKQIYKKFGLRFEIFGNTSDPANHEMTKHLVLKLYKNGLIEERETSQLYCIDDERFLPDRFVRGTCPNCGYENARGDQCESCTRVLDPKDLLNPRSAISGSQKIEVRESKHLFLNLPKVQDKIAGWIETKKDRWPKTSYSIAKKWINEGIQSRSITRDLKWGIAVPIAGYESKVIYVWVDAPIGYISATIQWARSIGNPDLWQSYWKDPSTKLVQFMGKDNVPFHTVTWPATMIGADDGFVLADIVKGFEWLNYEGSKFSTSQKRGVFLDQALETFPADCWRYYLLLVAPERHDTDFTWAGFQQAVNNDLANVLGNFIHRTLTFILREFNGAIPSIGELSEQDRNVLNAVKTAVNDLRQQFGDLEFQKAVAVVRQFWSICNTYFQDVQPWRLVKEDKSRASTVLGVCAYLCYVAAIISQPAGSVSRSCATIFRSPLITIKRRCRREATVGMAMPEFFVRSPRRYLRRHAIEPDRRAGDGQFAHDATVVQLFGEEGRGVEFDAVSDQSSAAFLGQLRKLGQRISSRGNFRFAQNGIRQLPPERPPHRAAKNVTQLGSPGRRLMTSPVGHGLFERGNQPPLKFR